MPSIAGLKGREKKQGKTKFCLLLPMEIGGHGRKTQ